MCVHSYHKDMKLFPFLQGRGKQNRTEQAMRTIAVVLAAVQASVKA